MNTSCFLMGENLYVIKKLAIVKRKNTGSKPWRKKCRSAKPRYKARLVVKGYEQKHGNDYDEVFSPVVKMTSIRLALSLIAKLGLEVEQLDVKTAFFHGELEENIYVTT
ncbi:hypothetical protein LIER_07487 [Lithospermum erythrorhizon]|uniref:Reverse transcriptase Ty1/copia-type domain-containing protein n=1 Tax=Lithospermum erythrorhizon TaxID=34254 RepID=A0AAV3P9P1_LITER